MNRKLERILPRVRKPARYTGGEYGEIQKDLTDVELRMALCFPDVYEIGMSNTGMRILTASSTICPASGASGHSPPGLTWPGR